MSSKKHKDRVSHEYPPPEFELPHTLHDDRHRLAEVTVPIVTISASYRGEIARHLGETSKFVRDVVFSRAHYSMALAVFSAARLRGFSCWMIDPTNYVSSWAWRKLVLVEYLAKLSARVPLFKKAKNFADYLIRKKSPITGSIRDPLLYATHYTKIPIVSLHYEAGNILAAAGKQVLQIVTDPHVRAHYLFEAHRENINFAVFDEKTKQELLERAKSMRKNIPPKRVFVSGPPVDPRIVAARKKKGPGDFKKRGLRILIATGGLGTNKREIRELLSSVLPVLEQEKISLILYAGTHADFREMFYELPKKHNVSVGDIETDKPVRVIYDESIVRANQELVEHAFSWADVIVTKPSGDMAYDGAASGCALFFLDPWGEWERRIEDIFVRLGIGQEARTKVFADQLKEAMSSGWLDNAIKNTLALSPVFLHGAEKIVDFQQKLARSVDRV